MTIVIEKSMIQDGVSAILGKMEEIAGNEELLKESCGSCRILFEGYDKDPRELYEIPEVVSWFRGTVSAGVPWFYFADSDPSTQVLPCMMALYAGEKVPGDTGYRMNRERLVEFLERSFGNLNVFAERHHISEDVVRKLSHGVSACVIGYCSKYL